MQQTQLTASMKVLLLLICSILSLAQILRLDTQETFVSKESPTATEKDSVLMVHVKQLTQILGLLVKILETVQLGSGAQ